MNSRFADRKTAGEYVVEVYLPSRAAPQLERLAARAQAAAEELNGEGEAVRYVRSVFVPGEETCFHIYEAASPELVEAAATRAGVRVERLVAAVEIDGDSERTPPRAQTSKEEKE